MVSNHNRGSYDPLFVRSMIESFLRIGLLVLLLVFSYDIIRPFTVPIMWGAIIAIAAFPLVTWLEPFLGGRRGLASSLVCLLFVLVLVIPAWTATDAILGGIRYLSAGLEDGSLRVPPPNPKVAQWPLVGETLHAGWSAANRDLESVVHDNAGHIRELAGAVLKRLGNGLVSVLMFVVAIVIAGGFMTFAESCGAAAHRFFVRVGGLKPGGEWAPLTVATVRSVLQGVVGVAVIQTILISIGIVAADIPGAPLWCAIVLVLTIAQLPPMLLLAPMIIYLFSQGDTMTAVIFTVYQLLAGFSDTALKPLLMGRGLSIPMPIILIGAIGGMIMAGIIGLFAGAVVLSIWYKLFQLWLAQNADDDDDAAAAPTARG